MLQGASQMMNWAEHIKIIHRLTSNDRFVFNHQLVVWFRGDLFHFYQPDTNRINFRTSAELDHELNKYAPLELLQVEKLS